MQDKISPLYRKVLRAEILFALATTEGVTSSPRIALLTDAAALLDGKRLPAIKTRPQGHRADPQWATAGEIGDEIGTSPGVVGRCLTIAGLHGSQDKDRKWSKVNGAYGNGNERYLYDRSVVSAVVAVVHKNKEIFEAMAAATARQGDKS